MRMGFRSSHAWNFSDLHHFLFLVPTFLDDFFPVALLNIVPFILIVFMFMSPRCLTAAVLVLRVRGLTKDTSDLSALLVFLDLLA